MEYIASIIYADTGNPVMDFCFTSNHASDSKAVRIDCVKQLLEKYGAVAKQYRVDTICEAEK